MASPAACLIFCALAVIVLSPRNAVGVPLGDEELTKGEMQTQEVEVTYTISRPADDEYVDETANDGDDADSADHELVTAQATPRRAKGPLPLERAITYPDAVLLPLEFSSHVHKKPKRKNLKKKKLMQKMGDDFDPLWMSVEPVTRGDDDEDNNGEVEMSDRQLDQIEREVSALHLEDEMERLTAESDDSNDVLTMSAHSSASSARRDLIRVFEQWLVKKSSCPVRFEWEDLGDYFWPRHVRKGACARKPCSWPSGMECAVDEVRTLQLLRWHCRRAPLRGGSRGRRTGQDQHRCKWYKVPYTVTTSCKCACQ